jgi:hypothetical protein
MRSTILPFATALLVFAAPAGAQVSRDNFLLRTTGDLVILCGVSPDDPNASAAMHFCEGYFVGLDHLAEVTGRPFRGTLFCPPENPGLTRDQVAGMVVAWHRKNPQYASERPFDGIARWAAATWPCKK